MKRIAPVAVLVAVAAIGLGMTWFVHAAANRTAQSQFDIVANEATDRLENRIGQHLLLLNSTAAHMETSTTPLAPADFGRFVSALKLTENYSGARGIGFALLTDAGKEEETSALIRANYAIERRVWPEVGQDLRTPIVLIEPLDTRNRAAIGYDMFSEERRRTALKQAVETGKPTATAPVELVQEVTAEKQNGFLVYIPVKLDAAPGRLSNSYPNITGFVYTPFRAGDLHSAAWSSYDLPAVFETVDVDAGNALLSKSRDFATVEPTSAFRAEREIVVAGRKWRIRYGSTAAFNAGNRQIGTPLLAIVSLLFAAALATSMRAQLRSLDAANKLAAVSLQAAEDKDMMLQEMKHRIKNSIARVLAIARQTASGSTSFDEFSGSFFSRLQAMASAQELLTRSHWEKAELRELLDSELHQVLGDSWDRSRLKGQDISLNARATQALGLTFHELATNALKYGDQKGIEQGLAVTWGMEKVKEKDVLRIDWQEPGGCHTTPVKSGFGSKLIAMNVERELGGALERLVDSNGLLIRLLLPTHTIF
jgi:CHASE1-domain containing sensor protein